MHEKLKCDIYPQKELKIKLTCLKNLSLLKELFRKLSNLSFSSSKFWRGEKRSEEQYKLLPI